MRTITYAVLEFVDNNAWRLVGDEDTQPWEPKPLVEVLNKAALCGWRVVASVKDTVILEKTVRE